MLSLVFYFNYFYSKLKDSKNDNVFRRTNGSVKIDIVSCAFWIRIIYGKAN